MKRRGAGAGLPAKSRLKPPLHQVDTLEDENREAQKNRNIFFPGDIAVNLSSIRVICVGFFASAVLAASSAFAESGADHVTSNSVWISPGFWSHHFDRSAGYREDNIGFGAEFDFSRDLFVQAGSYINSDRERSRYVGGAWEPFERWGIKAGIYGGAFDGYPAMHRGGLFAAAFPIISMRTDRIGLNLTIIPNAGNRLHGAVVAQALFRIW
jgi:hypothetical protein